ncbi:bifunctional non-homologous end joining protein LigD [Sporosarcina sp. NCCP-2222]|uniref:DNA ligase D n=1 Tax=Sporosarcina sp. NCCP-2222 TaxID=2935073 RepID=UPI00207F7141|nr:DNA ligase D [Sporosarcina sp. NCCP-2222]GKV54618.1 bifunctional non-homologous end joining protein LigD [Sporosarcina sp. NCCP-2222]
MKPMLLTDADNIPEGQDWIYETKYDGFRCLLDWSETSITLTSRNGNRLNEMFPEIIQFCHEIQDKIKSLLPIHLDGELVHLQNNFKSEFVVVQTRGRMRKADAIRNHSRRFPCHYVAFDLLKWKGKDITGETLMKRKKQLQSLFAKLKLPCSVNYASKEPLQLIEATENASMMWEAIHIHNGEGLVAKKKTSDWSSEKRTPHWVKVKNWKTVHVIVTKYEAANGFFTGSLFKDQQLLDIVTFRHGLSDDEFQALASLFTSNGTKIEAETWRVDPSICVQINCIDFDGKHLREPRFHSFSFEWNAEQCTWRQMLREVNPIAETVPITHPDKPVWPKMGVEKDDFLYYLQVVFPYIGPFLHNRLLTVIRYPHGVVGERFYQKNAPDYKPDFVVTKREEGIDYLLCNDIQTLLWLGNQLALEYHIPFQTIDTACPTEIVFDLDPPSVQEFSLAVEAALRLKVICDQFKLETFVKTSGGKGLQVYIPLPFDTFTYEDTRVFTEFVAEFLCEQEPQWFTTERLKKNRGNRLYIDYVQHQEGKTIVAPYSTRGGELATVATPLEWQEVSSQLRPEMFTIPTVLDRIKQIGNPFRNFKEVGANQPFEEVLKQLTEL